MKPHLLGILLLLLQCIYSVHTFTHKIHHYNHQYCHDIYKLNIIRGERPGEIREDGPNDGNDTGEEMIVGK